jgi:Electron transfer DM13
VTAAFTRTGYNVTGTATLTVEDGVAQLDFSENFSIARTPGPFVYLNTNANPNMGQPLRVGALRSLTGAQRYTFQIPAGVRYTHVIIWCDPFNVGMAQAAIPPTP